MMRLLRMILDTGNQDAIEAAGTNLEILAHYAEVVKPPVPPSSSAEQPAGAAKARKTKLKHQSGSG